MDLITTEANLNAKTPLNIDFMGKRYNCLSSYSVPSPSLWAIEKNLFYLLRYSKEENFKPKYKMKPSYLSFDEYGTVMLDYLLMYINNVFCIEDFDLVSVIIPKYSAIVDICKDRFKNDNPSSFETINW